MKNPYEHGYYIEDIRRVDLGEVCQCGEIATWEVVASGDCTDVQQWYCEECKRIEFDKEKV